MTVGPETCYRVRGGVPLRGTVFVQGAKNAALKMIAASLLASDGRTIFYVTEDPVTKRHDKFWRHAVGTAASDLHRRS